MPPALVVPVSSAEQEEQQYLLNEERAIGHLAASAAPTAAEKSSSYTEDTAVANDFQERQRLGQSGREQLLAKMADHAAESPELAGGDIDAAWDQSEVGTELVGGSAPTPDQDLVDEIGAAAGLTYEDDEPLRTGEKLTKRDEERWELDPESAEEQP